MPEIRPAEEITLKTHVAGSRRARPRILSAGALALSLLVLAPSGLAGATGHAPVRMPRLVGLDRPHVYAVMRSLGLYFVTRGPGAADGHWQSVRAQSVRPGTLVPWHSQVALAVSTAPWTGPRAVPRLVGLNRPQVYAAMRHAHLFFVTQGPGGLDGHWNRVVSQRPAAGTQVGYQSTVWLTVTIVRPRPPATTTTVHHPTTTTSTTTSTTTTTTPGETTTTTSPTDSTTTTTHPVTTTTVRRRPHKYAYGLATWYSYIPGRCATWFIPYGHRLWIMDLSTHKVITCVVSDIQASKSNHIVDLSMSDFSRLAPLARGIVRVKIWWR